MYVDTAGNRSVTVFVPLMITRRHALWPQEPGGPICTVDNGYYLQLFPYGIGLLIGNNRLVRVYSQQYLVFVIRVITTKAWFKMA